MGFCDQVNKDLEGYSHIVLIHACIHNVSVTHNGKICVESCFLVEDISMWIGHYMTWLWDLCFLWIFLLLFFCCFFFFHSPQISVKLLVHKIESPQEWEALQALTVCIDIIFLLFLYHYVLHQNTIYGFMQALCRFSRLAWRTVGEYFTMKLGNLGFWMNWSKAFHPK